MEANKILQSNYLDILFDLRNKDYGAYELRRGYNKRLLLSLSAIGVITVVFFGVNYLAKQTVRVEKQAYSLSDVQLEEIRPEKRTEPPPPPKAPVQKVEITKFTPPKIVKDIEVIEKEKPPIQDKLENTKIGVINQEGIKDEGVVTSSSEGSGIGIVEAPRVNDAESYDQTFTKVEIESEYPGGMAAWIRFLNRNFRYPDDALNKEIQGTVTVQFIVDKEGVVSDVVAVSGPEMGGLREEAIRVIKQSGKWTPAIQNDRKVKSYKLQPIVFKLAQQG